MPHHNKPDGKAEASDRSDKLHLQDDNPTLAVITSVAGTFRRWRRPIRLLNFRLERNLANFRTLASTALIFDDNFDGNLAGVKILQRVAEWIMRTLLWH